MHHWQSSGMGGVRWMISTMGVRMPWRTAMKIRGISGKWNAMWNSSPSPKYGRTSSGHWLASASSTRPGNFDSSRTRNSFRTACVSGRFSQMVPGRSIR
jgi:hypothetical protein